MNEEIVIKFGGDLTALGTSLRGLNAQVKAAGQGMKKEFESAFSGIGEIISGGVILAGIKSVVDHFDELQKRADNLAISTDFLQGMEHISSTEAVGGVEKFDKAIEQLSVNLGEAKKGNEEMIKKFQQWGITLKDISSLNTEGMFYKIAERIKSIPDPAERSAAAFELLGKSGKSLTGVMSEGADAVKSMVDQVDKLDAKKIKDLAEAKKNIENASNTATVVAGKTLGGVAGLGHFLGNLSMGDIDGINDFEDALNKREHDANTPKAGPDKTALAAQAEKLQAAADKYHDAQMMNGTDEMKMVALMVQQARLQKEINAIQGNTVEKYALKTQLDEKSKAISEMDAKMKKDAADKQKEADEKHQKKLKEEQKLTDDIHHTRNEISKLNRDRSASQAASQRADYMPSLEELASSGFGVFRHNQTEFQQGPFAGMARQLLNLQSDAKQSLIWGNQDRFKNDTTRIDELKKALTAAGVMSPDDRLQSIDDRIGEAKDHLKELVATAKGDGIIVKGTDE